MFQQMIEKNVFNQAKDCAFDLDIKLKLQINCEVR